MSTGDIEKAATQDEPPGSGEPDARAQAWAATTEPRPKPRTKAARASDDVNPYEAPAKTGEAAAEYDAHLERQKRFEAKGHFWLGFVAGLFIGPIAYLLTTSSGPQTNRGASWGAAIQFTFFMSWRFLLR